MILGATPPMAPNTYANILTEGPLMGGGFFDTLGFRSFCAYVSSALFQKTNQLEKTKKTNKMSDPNSASMDT